MLTPYRVVKNGNSPTKCGSSVPTRRKCAIAPQTLPMTRWSFREDRVTCRAAGIPRVEASEVDLMDVSPGDLFGSDVAHPVPGE